MERCNEKPSKTTMTRDSRSISRLSKDLVKKKKLLYVQGQELHENKSYFERNLNEKD
jgi:hypothetical protein